jgi:hypothetical protein
MRARITGSLLAVMAGALLAAPASASAAARYASPTGSGTACTLAAPCDLVTAVNNAANGDDVTIEPGSYTASTTLDDNGFNLTIHGQAGAARPVITNSSTEGMGLLGPNTSVSDIELDIASPNTSPGLVTASTETIDRVIVKITSNSDTEAACAIAGTMTDSVCWTSATNGNAAFVNTTYVSSAAATFRNDTLEATGTSGTGVTAGAAPGQNPTIALVNSIAHGGHTDLLAESTSGGTASVTADHSNFATSTQMGIGASAPAAGSGTNQTAAPHFVNAATGDFHQLAGSPTIDAGADSSSNGSVDLDGLPRTMGAHTDIGAYEYPVPVCQSASATTPFGKAVNVQLQCSDPGGASVTSYGVVTPPSHGTVSINASGLATYTPASGYSGPDSFTFDATSSHGTGAPATATITVSPGSGGPLAITKVSQSHRRWRRGNALPHIASAKRPPVGTTFRFTVNEAASVRFVFTKRGRKRGTLSFNVGAGKHKLRFQGRISKHKRLKPGRYTLTITATNAAGQSASTKLKFTIAKG